METRLERLERVLRTGLFLLALAIPLLGTLSNRALEISRVEQRVLADAPGLPRTATEWRAFPGAISAWFNDHFGLREPLVRLNQKLTAAAGMERLGPAPALEGRDGWLFLSGDRTLEDYQGQIPYSDTELKRWNSALMTRQQWLKQRGIAYLFVITPNKQSIYPEFLPAWLDGRRGETRADQLLRNLRKDIALLDLRPVLLLAKGPDALYRKYDTHWNARGADVGRHHIVAALLEIYPNLDLWMGTEFTWNDVNIRGGDLARIMGRPEVSEWLPKPATERGLCRTNVTHRTWVEISTGTPLIDKCRKGELTALVFRDSFMFALRPLLSPYFKRSTYVWKQPDPCTMRKLVKKYHPDVVIEQATERLLVAPSEIICAD